MRTKGVENLKTRSKKPTSRKRSKEGHRIKKFRLLLVIVGGDRAVLESWVGEEEKDRIFPYKCYNVITNKQ